MTQVGLGLGGTLIVRFEVNSWFRGGTGDTVWLRMASPRSTVEDAAPTYGVGTRLLLSGADVNGDFWPWTCGFTRYYDQDAAAVWARVFSG